MPNQGHGKMSEKYIEKEKQNKIDEIEKVGEEAKERTVVYWAPSPGYKIGNFVKEEWSGGRCVRAESSLSFLNHIHTADPDTDDGKKAIEFIESSNAFDAGIVKKCKDVAEASVLTAQLQAMRKVTQLKCESISMTKHTE